MKRTTHREPKRFSLDPSPGLARPRARHARRQGVGAPAQLAGQKALERLRRPAPAGVDGQQAMEHVADNIVHVDPGLEAGIALRVLVQAKLGRALARNVPRRLAKHEHKEHHAAGPGISLLPIVARHGPPALLLEMATQILWRGIAEAEPAEKEGKTKDERGEAEKEGEM